MQPTDRAPIDPQALALCVARVLGASPTDPDDQEDAAKALLDEALRQGVMTPAEHREAWLEPFDLEAGVVIDGFCEEFGILVRPDGSTECLCGA